MSRTALLARISALEMQVTPEDLKAGLVLIIGLAGPTSEQLAAAAQAREEGRPVITVQTFDARKRPDPDGDDDV